MAQPWFVACHIAGAKYYICTVGGSCVPSVARLGGSKAKRTKAVVLVTLLVPTLRPSSLPSLVPRLPTGSANGQLWPEPGEVGYSLPSSRASCLTPVWLCLLPQLLSHGPSLCPQLSPGATNSLSVSCIREPGGASQRSGISPSGFC